MMKSISRTKISSAFSSTEWLIRRTVRQFRWARLVLLMSLLLAASCKTHKQVEQTTQLDLQKFMAQHIQLNETTWIQILDPATIGAPTSEISDDRAPRSAKIIHHAILQNEQAEQTNEQTSFKSENTISRRITDDNIFSAAKNLIAVLLFLFIIGLIFCYLRSFKRKK